MKAGVRKFFERYTACFNQALGGDMDMDEVAALYASEFIGEPKVFGWVSGDEQAF